MALLKTIQAVCSCFCCWKPRITKAGTPQVVLACTFGRTEGEARGKSNTAIFEQVNALARMRNIPFCIQSEVAQGLASIDGGYVSANTYDYHGKGYVGTQETVLEMVEEFCQPNDLQEVLVVAHRHHAWRVVQVCEKLGLQVVEVYCKDIPYDPQSTQPWCRSSWNFCKTFPYPPFIIYEIAARLYYLSKGWLRR